MEKETIEQAAAKIFPHNKGLTIIASNKIMLRRSAFIKGAKWQQERTYSEEEVLEIFDIFKMCLPFHYEFLVKERFKKH